MRTRQTLLAAVTALTLGTTAGAVPVLSQDFEGEPPGPSPYGYEDGPDGDEPRYRPRRFRREGGGRGGSVCVTARGNCIVPPAPYNAPCGCVIPGFGPKRGAVGG